MIRMMHSCSIVTGAAEIGTKGTGTTRAAQPSAGRGSVMPTLWAALLAVSLGAGLAGCGKGAPEEAAAPAPKLDNGAVQFPDGNTQVSSFTLEAVKTGGPRVTQLAGRIVWDEERTVRVFPPFGGRVLKILARPGDAVKAGQVLAVLASPDFGQAQSDARRAEADLALAEKNLARMRELHGAGVVAAKDLQAAEADQARAASEQKRADARVRLYGAPGTVDQTLAMTSPIGGVLVERNINPGQELRPDLQLSATPAALFVVTDPSRLWVQLEANESDIASLRRGQAIRLRAGAWPDATFEAKIESIADFVDPATRTVKIRASVDNRERKLKGEMYVTAEVTGSDKPALQVPSKAVFLFGDKYFVFVAESPRRFRRVEVKVGADAGGRMTILSGLTEGQNVVVEGSLHLQRIARELETGAPV